MQINASVISFEGKQNIHVSFYTLKSDLEGTTSAYDCHMRFLERALLASCKKIAHNSRHSTLPIPTIVVAFNIHVCPNDFCPGL